MAGGYRVFVAVMANEYPVRINTFFALVTLSGGDSFSHNGTLK